LAQAKIARMTRDDKVQAGADPPRGAVGYRGLLRQAARAPDSYGLLLLVLLIDYTILSVGWTGPWALMVTTAFIGLTGLLAFHTSRVRETLVRAELIATVLALAASVVAVIEDSDRAKGVAFIIMSLLVAACPIAIVSRIVHHTRVTTQTLLAAICLYVLIGILFAYVDFAYQLISGMSYFAQSGHHGPPDFVYFSFITMTTVGYGDLSPAHGLPRNTAVLEALTGQVVLVVLVARLVAMYSPMTIRARQALIRGERVDDSRPPGAEDEPSTDDSVPDLA